MRLAFLYRRLARVGGTEGDLYRTVASLAQRGHDVHVFCGEFRVPAPPGVTAHRVPVLRAGRVARLLSFAWAAPRAAARAGGWDVVTGFGRTARQDLVRCGGGTHGSYLAAMRATGARGRALGIYHRAILALEAAQYREGRYRRVLAVSERVCREIITEYGVPAARTSVLYNGVDLTRFAPDNGVAMRGPMREHLGVPADSRIILSVGSGFRRKGIDTLLRLWSAGAPARAWLVVVGDDERLGAYRRRAARSELGGKVVIAGNQTAIEKWYAAADALVVASVQEAFGNVVLEGLAAGLPVITSSRVGASEILRGSLRDLLVEDPCDPDVLRDRIEVALGPRREELSRSARLLAQEWSWPAHFERLEDILARIATAVP